MSTNPYLDMLDAPPEVGGNGGTPSEGNPYASMLDAELATQAKQGVLASSTLAPAPESAAQRLSKITGVPLEAVRLRQKEVEQQYETASINYEALARSNPRTTAMLGNPEDAVFARGDLPQLTEMEKQFGYIQNIPQPEPTLSSYLYGLATSGAEAVQRIGYSAQSFGSMLAGEPTREAYFVRKAESSKLQVYGTTPNFKTEEAAYLYSGLQSTVQAIPTLTAGIATGTGPAIPLVAAGVSTFGDAYTKYRSRGATSFEAAFGAITEGGVEVATEKLPLGFITERFGKTGIKGLVLGYLSREMPSEQAATLAQDFIDTAIANPDKTWGEYIAERPQAAYATAIATLAQTAVLGGASEIARFTSGETTKAIAQQRERVTQRRALVAQSQSANAALKEVFNLASTSKTRELSPDTFKRFIDSNTQDTPLETVFVNPAALQQAGLDTSVVSQLSPEVKQQFEEAVVTGRDVAIPTLLLVTQLAGTPEGEALLPHLKADPQLLSEAETTVFAQSEQQQLEEQAQQLGDSLQKENTWRGEEQALASTVAERITETGGWTNDVAQTDGILVSKALATLAADAGVTPKEMAKYLPTIVGNRTGGGLAQAAAPTTLVERAVAVADTVLQRAGLRTAPAAPLAQNSVNPRGTFDPETNIISLMRTADLSTFLHETGHWLLTTYETIAAQPDAPVAVKEKTDAVLTWLKVEGDTPEARLANWRGRSIDAQRAGHEQFAESFELYLFEGRAPSADLRAVFRTFRAWLLGVYRSVKEFMKRNPAAGGINDDIRNVFDRMLATSDEINYMAENNGMVPMFDNPDAVGMTPEEYKAYHALDVEQRTEAIEQLERTSLRDMQWLTNAQKAANRRVTQDIRDKRATISAEVFKEVMAEPVQRLNTYLRKGELDGQPVEGGPVRINLEGAKEILGDRFDQMQGKYGKYGVFTSEGAPPAVVAEMFGYSSADEMLTDLVNRESVKAKVDRITDQRVTERFGELATPTGVKRAVSEAVHNEARGRFIASELFALQKALKRPRLSIEAAKIYAANAVDRTIIRNLSESVYEVAERRASRLAMEALRRNDLVTATQEKRNEVLSYHMAREAALAKETVEKDVKYLKRFDKPNMAKVLTPESLDLVHQLLERLELRALSNKEIDRRAKFTEWVAEQTEILGSPPDIDMAIFEVYSKQSYKNMKVEDFRGLVSAIRQIEHLGRRTQKVLTDKKNREFGELKEELIAHLEANAAGRKIVDVRNLEAKRKGPLSNFKAFLGWQQIKMHAVVQQMDGFKPGGLAYEIFERPKVEAGTNEQAQLRSVGGELNAIMRPLLTKGFLTAKTFFPGINRSFSKGQIFTLATQLGTETGRQRLANGDVEGGYSEANLTEIFSTLSKEEFDALQKIWDLFEGLRPQLEAKELRVTGAKPVWEKAVPVQTQYGTFRGGYAPIGYDPYQAVRSSMDKSSKDAAKETQRARRQVSTSRGRLIKRENKVTDQYLTTDFSTITTALRDSIHDIHWHEYAVDTNRFLRDKAFNGAINRLYGPDHLEVIRASRDVSVQGEQHAHKGFEQVAVSLRNNATAASLGLSITAVLAQPAGIIVSAERIGPGYVLRAVKEFASRPNETTEFVRSKSTFMRERAFTMTPELASLNQALTEPGFLDGAIDKYVGLDKAVPVREAYKASVFYFTQKAQTLVDLPTWLAAYNRALVEGQPDDMAVAVADSAVNATQGSGLVSDQSRIQYANSLFKIFTVFYTPFGAMLQRYYELGAEAQQKPQKITENIARAMAITVLPAVYMAMLGGLYASLRGDEEEFSFWDKLAAETIASIMNPVVGLREFTTPVQQALGINSFSGQYSGPAGARALTDAMSLMKQVGQAEADDALLRSTVNVAGSWLGLPSTAINRLIFGGYDWIAEDGNMFNVLLGPSK